MDKYGAERVKTALGKLKKELESRYVIDKALMFGSRARGDWLYSSDVDLILVSPDFGGKKFSERAADVLAHWKEDVDLEVLCYTPDEFERKSRQLGIVGQAVKEGIAI